MLLVTQNDHRMICNFGTALCCVTEFLDARLLWTCCRVSKLWRIVAHKRIYSDRSPQLRASRLQFLEWLANPAPCGDLRLFARLWKDGCLIPHRIWAARERIARLIFVAKSQRSMGWTEVQLHILRENGAYFGRIQARCEYTSEATGEGGWICTLALHGQTVTAELLMRTIAPVFSDYLSSAETLFVLLSALSVEPGILCKELDRAVPESGLHREVPSALMLQPRGDRWTLYRASIALLLAGCATLEDGELLSAEGRRLATVFYSHSESYFDARGNIVSGVPLLWSGDGHLIARILRRFELAVQWDGRRSYVIAVQHERDPVGAWLMRIG